ncbi:MAG: DUF4105 domain-containing protein [Nevskia sp.]
MLLRLAAIVLLACTALTAAAAEDGFVPSSRPADTISVSLLTFQPGTEYWQRFGHNAILLRDSSSGAAITYNYGLFDFRQKHFFLNFARGLMVYKVAPNWLANDLPVYAEDGRWALEQKLDLSPEQRSWLRDYLEWNVLPEHAEYRYDYFVSNCSTRVRDALDRALGGALRRQLEGRASGVDYRHEALRLIAPDRPLMIAMDAALGPTADRPIDVWQQSFGPLTLMQALRGVKLRGSDGSERPLVSAETYLLKPGALRDPLAQPPDLRLPFLGIGLVLAGLLALLARLRPQHAAARIAFALAAGAFALASGLAGLILLLMWSLTDHWAGWRNENLLLLSPLTLLLLPAWLSSLSPRWTPGGFARGLAQCVALGAVAALLLRLTPFAFQDNLHWALLLLPAQLVLGLAMRVQPAPTRKSP